MRKTTFAAARYLACVSLCASASARSFMGLGDLPGGEFSSVASGLSGDGRFVTGRGQIVGELQEAFLWTEGSGMVGLGLPTGSDNSRGSAVTNDGGTVVGTHGFEIPTRAYVWTAGSGPVDFDPFPMGAANRSAGDVSADGSTIVGSFQPGESENDVAYHWSGGTLTEIGLGRGLSVSANGGVVVGTTLILDFPNPVVREAFLWTEAEGMALLGFLPGGSELSLARGISADGNVVVGGSNNASAQSEAFRWTESGGMVGLGDLPGGDFNSIANATTADGSIVVGSSNVLASLPASFDPFIWDEAHGMRNLVDVLVNDYGLGNALAGWDLSEATAISDDGRVIVGNGVNPDGNSEAWIARLVPEPSTALLGVLACAGLLTHRRRRDWQNTHDDR